MYAVIKTGGKQYSVKVGDVVYVEKLNAEDNKRSHLRSGSRRCRGGLCQGRRSRC